MKPGPMDPLTEIIFGLCDGTFSDNPEDWNLTCTVPELLTALRRGKRHMKHKKRQTTYLELGELEFQTAKGGVVIEEGDKITVYQADDGGKLYGRLPEEFNDGRFENLGEY